MEQFGSQRRAAQRGPPCCLNVAPEGFPWAFEGANGEPRSMFETNREF